MERILALLSEIPLIFRASDGTNGRELWKSDGTASGTVMVKDIQKAVSTP